MKYSIRNFWKIWKDDIKKNYVISTCSSDFDLFYWRRFFEKNEV